LGGSHIQTALSGSHSFKPTALPGVPDYNVTDITGGIDNESVSRSKNETNFAWSLGAGVVYDFTENWTVDFGYRYIDAGEVSLRLIDNLGDDFDKRKIKVQTHDIMLGIRYTF
jgi:opacity protein-like surface antigen